MGVSVNACMQVRRGGSRGGAEHMRMVAKLLCWHTTFETIHLKVNCKFNTKWLRFLLGLEGVGAGREGV